MRPPRLSDVRTEGLDASPKRKPYDLGRVNDLRYETTGCARFPFNDFKRF